VSRVHDIWNKVFFKILKKPFLVQKETIPHMKAKLIFIDMKQNILFFKRQFDPKWTIGYW
jgi:hypothetical protein